MSRAGEKVDTSRGWNICLDNIGPGTPRDALREALFDRLGHDLKVWTPLPPALWQQAAD